MDWLSFHFKEISNTITKNTFSKSIRELVSKESVVLLRWGVKMNVWFYQQLIR